MVKNSEINKYFDRLTKEEEQNEYNRTEINERELGKSVKNRNLNTSGIKVVDKIDSACHTSSYVNITKASRKNQI